ncbi:MAG TPA: DUF4129 domain-containing protein [Candidatus Limnocylindrales bacterium]|nr:DUF4129 domain-containing protein [Candidatus Limnocylindrales bacterium]
MRRSGDQDGVPVAGAGLDPDGRDRRARRTSSIVGLAPVGLVVVAEAAWISVVAGLVEAFAFHDPILGIPAIGAFVATGIVAARLLGRRLGNGWPMAALAITLLAGIVGWLASPTARASLGDGLGPAIAAHPGGWLAGLAVLRGFAHARLPLLEGTIARLLGLGVPGLAVCAILGGVIGEPVRGRFLADTLGASIVFVVAATLALAMTRLTTVGGDAGFDWRRNPTWMLMTVGLLVVAVLAAIPLSVVAGTAIQAVFAIAVGPLLVVGLLTGLDATVRRILALIFAAGIALLVVLRLIGANPATPNPAPSPAAGQGRPAVVDQLMTISLGGLLLIGAVIAVLVLAAIWLERTRPPDEDLIDESRTIDRGEDQGPHRRPRRWVGRRREPRDAEAAYIALDRELDRHAGVRRMAGETPAEHAARLRSERGSPLSLDLLAADYELARYAGRKLPAREDRRAIARWRHLRRVLTRAEARRPG